MTNEHPTSVVDDHADATVVDETPEPKADQREDRTSLGLFPEFPKKPWWHTALVLAIYLGLWAYWTRPLFEHLNSSLLGGVGDQTGFLSLYRELHQEGLLGLAPGRIPDFAGPEGLEHGWVNLFGQAPASLMASALFAVFTPLAAVSIFATIGIVGTALATYGLSRRITGSTLAAFIAGFGCGFAPYLVLKSTGHTDFAHAWVFVLMLWAWLRLIDAPSWRRVPAVAAATLLAAAWTAYFALLAGVAGAVLALLLIATQFRGGKVLRSVAMAAAAGAPAVIWIGITLIVAKSDPSAALQPTRSLNELTVYAARPLDYLIPGPASAVIGDWAGEWRNANMHGSNLTESLLYPGYVAMLLALIGLITSFVRRQHRALIGILAAVGLTAVWFSLPPLVGVGGHLIPTPSRYVFEVQPGFRVYSRFVVLVLVVLAPVAAIGAAALLRWLKHPALQVGAVGVLTVLAFGDMQVGRMVNRVGEPPAYVALRQQPPGLVGEFPLMPAAQELNQATFYQQLGNHPILNGYREGSLQEARAAQLNDLSSQKTIRALRAIGVRYLVVRTDTDLVGWPDPGEPPAKDARLIKEDQSLKLYELKPGDGSLAFWFPNVGAAEPDFEKKPFQWLGEPRTTLHVFDDCKDCSAEATIKFGNFGPERQVTLDSGVAKKTVTVGASPQQVRIRVQLKNGRAKVNLTATPGAVRPSEVDPTNTDGRLLSLMLYPAKLEVEDGR